MVRVGIKDLGPLSARCWGESSGQCGPPVSLWEDQEAGCLQFHPSIETQPAVAPLGASIIFKGGKADPQGFFTYIPPVIT